MGRTPLSGWPLLRQLRRAGLSTSTFGYSTTFEKFSTITARLAIKIAAVATAGEYVLIGHSLGGVLLRAAVNALPPDSKHPHHAFLLGSPIHPSRLARRLGGNAIFRALTGDCGNLLGSTERMALIGSLANPTTSIVGLRGLPFTRSSFAGEPNDGVVAVSEVRADWLSDQVLLPVVHTLLPSSLRVVDVILTRVGPTK